MQIEVQISSVFLPLQILRSLTGHCLRVVVVDPRSSVSQLQRNKGAPCPETRSIHDETRCKATTQNRLSGGARLLAISLWKVQAVWSTTARILVRIVPLAAALTSRVVQWVGSRVEPRTRTRTRTSGRDIPADRWR